MSKRVMYQIFDRNIGNNIEVITRSNQERIVNVINYSTKYLYGLVDGTKRQFKLDDIIVDELEEPLNKGFMSFDSDETHTDLESDDECPVQIYSSRSTSPLNEDELDQLCKEFNFDKNAIVKYGEIQIEISPDSSLEQTPVKKEERSEIEDKKVNIHTDDILNLREESWEIVSSKKEENLLPLSPQVCYEELETDSEPQPIVTFEQLDKELEEYMKDAGEKATSAFCDKYYLSQNIDIKEQLQNLYTQQLQRLILTFDMIKEYNYLQIKFSDEKDIAIKSNHTINECERIVKMLKDPIDRK